ncbi:unnamed protein product [Sphagnum troendelagicum]|uniref:Glycosyltransferase family 92 protein n=1 Tax=Sphagnum troendelagicum TaxID=128251 RepID=A0ABP0UYV8_9BRYO
MTMNKISARSSFGKMNGKQAPMGSIAGISRLITKTPALICLLGLLVLMLVIFNSTGDLGGFRQHVRRLQVQEEEEEGLAEFTMIRSRRSSSSLPHLLPADNSLRSLKELVKEAMDKGLVIIVNATKADANQLSVDHPRGALPQWDVNAALDGPTGEILTEVIQELHNVEELQKEVAVLRAMQTHCANQTQNQDKACATRLKMLDESKTGQQHVPSAAAAAGPIFQGDHKFRPFQSSLPPLILFSSYRMSHEEFTLVTLVANSFGEKMLVQDATSGTCIWMQWDPALSSNHTPPLFSPPPAVDNQVPVQHGKKSYTFMSDPTKGGLPYDVAVIKCSFEDPAGSNGLGGHLYLKLGSGEFVPVFDEPPEAINHIQFEGPLKHSYAFCPPPILKPLNARYLKQWLMFNHYVFREGKLHYFIYHGIELDSATMSILQPLLDDGLLTLIDMSLDEGFVVGQEQYPNNHLALNDCLQRSRFFADWAFFWGFDEYLEIMPPQTLLGILESNKESPYITFGSQVWSSIYCSPPKNSMFGAIDEDWAVDRMFLHLEHPTCSDKSRSSTCVGPEGARKWAANPHKVYAGTIHYTMEPSWGGVNLDTGVARLNLYSSGDSKGPIDVGSDHVNCRIILDPEKVNASTAVDGFWWRDTSISATSQHAHDLAKASPLFSFGFPRSNTTAAEVEEGHSKNVT